MAKKECINTFLRWSRPAQIAAGILAIGFVITVAANWPGHLSYDSVLQLLQGRTGEYNNWHPPVMAWLLGLGDAVIPGAGLFVALDAALASGALLAIVLLAPGKAGWPAVLVSLAAATSPQLVVLPGIVWKDVLFGAAGVAGFACFAHAAANWDNRLQRDLWLAGSLPLLCTAALTRQNGIVLLPFAALAFGWLARKHRATRFRAGMLGTAAFLAMLTLVWIANAMLALRSDGKSGPAEQFRLLQIYDLAGAVTHSPNLPLPALSARDAPLAAAIRQHGPHLYTPERSDELMGAPAMREPLRNVDDDALASDWRGLILHHPGLYLTVRADDFAWLLFTPDIQACRPIFTGIDGPAAEMAELGLRPRKDARDNALAHYGIAFFGTPVFSHIPFLLVAIAGIVLLVRRARSEDIVMAAMLAGEIAFTLSFFAITIACDYRYLYALDLSALAALLYLALEPRSFLEGRP